MEFRVFFPPASSSSSPSPVPALIYLSGLTCTPANASEKAGAARMAAAVGLALVFPDTSPRGLGIPGEDDAYDLGTGAGFYVDATAEPWIQKNENGQVAGYRMFSYVTTDLIEALRALNIDTARLAITGHSMGGHGALIAGLKRPDLFHSISAFSPIAAPTRCPWGVKAFSSYLGEGDKAAWAAWDACELIKKYTGPARAILVDVGGDDEFAGEQLRVRDLRDAVKENENSPVSVNLRTHEGYDHSYFFIATLVDDHVRFHACALGLVEEEGGTE
jgi:S-formylglutathione hydrolase